MTWRQFQEDILPFWMLCTKSYGYTAEFLCWVCPAYVEPYIKLYELEQRKVDETAWLNGLYTYRATLTAIENAFSGKKSKLKYEEKPLSQQAKEEKGEMSHDEKMSKVKALFTRLQILQTNYEISHPKGGSE